MKRIFERSLLAMTSIAISSQVLGDCDEATKTFIRNSGGNKEAAIAHTRKMVADSKTNQSNAFWKQPKSYRQEMFAALDEEARELISSIQSCTDSDLASITPKAKASQSGNTASNCEQEVRITYRTGGSYYDASFRHLGGLDYEVFWHQNGQRDRGFLGKTLRQLYEDAENTNTDSPEANRE